MLWRWIGKAVETGARGWPRVGGSRVCAAHIAAQGETSPLRPISRRILPIPISIRTGAVCWTEDGTADESLFLVLYEMPFNA